MPLYDSPSLDATSGGKPPSSTLLRHLLRFGRFLRRAGVRVTSSQLIELTHSLSLIDITVREDFRATARAILVNRHDDLAVFDRAFDLFWGPRGLPRGTPDEVMDDAAARRLAQALEGEENRSLPQQTRTSREQRTSIMAGVESDGAEEDEGEPETIALYSPGEVLRHRDFAYLTQQELADARRFLAEMRWSITRRRSRRARPSRRGTGLDLRRSLRSSLRHGGELFTLSRRTPKLKRRQLVLLCDISGSMDRYTRLLLHFLHSMEWSRERTEVFVFGTRLTRITRTLQRRDPDAAITAVSEHVQDWSGGTRIGESLREFNLRWARRILGHGAIVIIISDGWDRGDPELLGKEMARLQRMSYRLLWLNPLLGSPNYQPLTQGILAALPYIDDFLPVHNLASLGALARLLNDIQEGRPERKHVHRET